MVRKRQYGRERCKNLSEDEKQNLVEYRKKYYRMRKNAILKLPETILIQKTLILYEKKYNTLLIFRLCKLPP